MLHQQAEQARQQARDRARDRARKQRGAAQKASESHADSASWFGFDGIEWFGHPEFIEALQHEAYSRTQHFFQGLSAVAATSSAREDAPHNIVWQHGNSVIRDCAPQATDAVAIMLVPSLINRSYILDLHPECSFIRFLVQQGFRPFVLDWGTPEDTALEYSCADYISGKAIPGLTAVRQLHDGPLTLLGYCMGGVFALAMAALSPQTVDALILLSTPWDFSVEDSPHVPLSGAAAHMLREAFAMVNPVPAAAINLCFHLIDPWGIQRRYEQYPTLSKHEQALFMAVEQWLADGVPLASRVAIETFVDWPQHNTLQAGTWRIGRSWITPDRIRCPSLLVIPEKDRIVPASCALPLADELPRCKVLQPALGHVSMLSSSKANTLLWCDIAAWLHERF